MKTRQPYEESSNRGKYLVGVLALFIISIMVFSVLSLTSEDTEEKIKYKDQLFVKTNQGWQTYINNQQYIFAYNPLELENITLPANFNINKLNSAQKLYLSFNPEEDIYLAMQEFYTLLKPLLTPKMQESCFIDIEKCSKLPLKTCEDATPDIKVILLKEDNLSKIDYQYNCLTLQGDSENLIKNIDKLSLNFLGL